MSPERVSLVIPAYNEASIIADVIEPALDNQSIADVIVVNDGSTDNTEGVANDYPVTVLNHNINLGKGEALHSGYTHAKELGATSLLFLDADLHGLRSSHIDDLLEPLLAGTAIMTIGILERTIAQRAILRRWGALSGQRALGIELWEQLRSKDRHGFNVEAALNARTRHKGQHHKIERVELRHVTHTGKREKEPTLLKAVDAYLRTYGAAALTYIRSEFVR